MEISQPWAWRVGKVHRVASRNNKRHDTPEIPPGIRHIPETGIPCQSICLADTYAVASYSVLILYLWDATRERESSCATAATLANYRSVIKALVQVQDVAWMNVLLSSSTQQSIFKTKVGQRRPADKLFWLRFSTVQHGLQESYCWRSINQKKRSTSSMKRVST